ncbi:MAG: glycosyltransferase [Sphingobacteriales bacterium]|nr:MAG: glycosyltransferase [Sphingobacteriales bacterium]
MQLNHRQARIKKYIELALMMPFVVLGKVAGRIFKLKTAHKHFLFFPNGDIGGSIRVNADIARLLADKKPLIIFSKKPKDNKFRTQFDIDGVRVIDLHKYIDNKWLHFLNFFFRGVLVSWIHASKDAVVFGGESIYFYKIIPHLKSSVRKIELCHVNAWFHYTLAFIDDIDWRIFSTRQIKRDMEALYEKNKLPKSYFDKLRFIDNKINIPESYTVNNNQVLQVLYVGRGAAQKRVHLIAAIAKKMNAAQLNVHFSFVGDVEKVVPEDVQEFCTMYGTIKDTKVLEGLYEQTDILILTSAYEGLPIVVMETMARGRIVLSTAVSGIPDYITDKENGLLLYAKAEAEIIEEGVDKIKWLLEHPQAVQKIGAQAYEYARSHFSAALFDKLYTELLD